MRGGRNCCGSVVLDALGNFDFRDKKGFFVLNVGFLNNISLVYLYI